MECTEYLQSNALGEVSDIERGKSCRLDEAIDLGLHTGAVAGVEECLAW